MYINQYLVILTHQLCIITPDRINLNYVTVSKEQNNRLKTRHFKIIEIISTNIVLIEIISLLLIAKLIMILIFTKKINYRLLTHLK